MATPPREKLTMSDRSSERDLAAIAAVLSPPSSKDGPPQHGTTNQAVGLGFESPENSLSSHDGPCCFYAISKEEGKEVANREEEDSGTVTFDDYDPSNKETSRDPKPRPIACNFAVRFTNRPNGTPLTTIIEQKSYSTLNSHPSLVSSTYRYTPAKQSESSPIHRTGPQTVDGRRRLSQSLDEVTLYKLGQATNQRHDAAARTDAYHASTQQLDLVDTLRHHPTSPKPFAALAAGCSPSDDDQTRGTTTGNAARGFKVALHGLLQNIREAPRHSLSLSALRNQFRQDESVRRASGRNTVPTAKDGYNFIGDPVMAPPIYHQTVTTHVGASSGQILDRSTHHSPRENEPNDNRAAESAMKNIASAVPPTPQFQVEATKPKNTPPKRTLRVPMALISHPASSSPTPSPSKFPSPPSLNPTSILSTYHTTNNFDRAISVPLLSNRSRDDLTSRYTYAGISIARPNAPSLRNYDRCRETSFGSTATTTSVSSSILGPQLERVNAHSSNPRAQDLHLTPAPLRLRTKSFGSTGTVTSVSSSTLGPQLERVNAHSTDPRPQDLYLTPAPLRLHTKSNPKREPSTPNYSTNSRPATHTIRSAALPVLLPIADLAGIPHPHFLPIDPTSPPTSPFSFSASGLDAIARPAILPSTSPPTSTAQLPAYLRHHHHTHTHIVPQASKVVGCDGMVRPKSLVPRSGVDRRCERTKAAKRKMGLDLGVGVWSKGGRDRDSGVGAAAGWALRVCFCQPEDGAGGGACVGEFEGEVHERVRRGERLENVRVVV
ncbi:hypothetical protein K432DRAFT_389825 [Lepidopterella palustris CBS 459.81]|uniref:Uncharacterized protein n=1 Tax=Lepidopterella palustris CBS 459.81 TaxID=1314670 RepID=A0A8E2JIT3_9PEZI|nr:hypothetical protein K432DRAFT_389825 [Lepidopterella palustris CBS 459.81]